MYSFSYSSLVIMLNFSSTRFNSFHPVMHTFIESGMYLSMIAGSPLLMCPKGMYGPWTAAALTRPPATLTCPRPAVALPGGGRPAPARPGGPRPAPAWPCPRAVAALPCPRAAVGLPGAVVDLPCPLELLVDGN